MLRVRRQPISGPKSTLINRLMALAGATNSEAQQQQKQHSDEHAIASQKAAQRCEAVGAARKGRRRQAELLPLEEAMEARMERPPLSEGGGGESESHTTREEEWTAVWRSRLECWFGALPIPTQAQLGGCLGAFGLHIGSRLESSLRAAGLRGGGAATAPLPLTHRQECDWVHNSANGGGLILPQFPDFRADFSLPPLPRLIPSWQRLSTRGAAQGGLVGDGWGGGPASLPPGGGDPPAARRVPFPVGAGAALGFATGAALAIILSKLRRRRERAALHLPTHADGRPSSASSGGASSRKLSS